MKIISDSIFRHLGESIDMQLWKQLAQPCSRIFGSKPYSELSNKVFDVTDELLNPLVELNYLNTMI